MGSIDQDVSSNRIAISFSVVRVDDAYHLVVHSSLKQVPPSTQVFKKEEEARTAQGLIIDQTLAMLGLSLSTLPSTFNPGNSVSVSTYNHQHQATVRNVYLVENYRRVYMVIEADSIGFYDEAAIGPPA